MNNTEDNDFELKEALEELDYIETHLEEYIKNNNWEDLKKEILKSNQTEIL